METNGPPRRFYRLRAAALADHAGAPTNYFSGATNAVDLGAAQPVLNKRDLTFTIRTQLPAVPLAADKAEVLWKFGGGNGISLVLMGDRLVFSGSSSTAAAGALNLSAALEPADFGRTITIRLTIDHKVSSTDFQMSYVVEGGSAAATAVALQPFVGYIGTSNGKVGLATGTITGISGTPFGLLAALPNGTADVFSWSSGGIRYEIAGTVGAPL